VRKTSGTTCALLRTTRAALDQKRLADALAHWADLRAHVPNVVTEVELMTRIAAVLAEGGAEEEAEDLVREAIGRIDGTTLMTTLVKRARGAIPHGATLATQAESPALAHPSIGRSDASLCHFGGHCPWLFRLTATRKGNVEGPKLIVPLGGP
jgi:hypothetical protein